MPDEQGEETTTTSFNTEFEKEHNCSRLNETGESVEAVDLEVASTSAKYQETVKSGQNIEAAKVPKRPREKGKKWTTRQ